MKHLTTPLILVAVILFSLAACSSKAPSTLGVQDGLFAPCPDTTNCVSSQATDAKHTIPPIAAHGGVDKVMVDLGNAIESMFGAKVVTVEGPYLHAIYTSRVMRFVDDLECYYDENKGVIEIRSASRIGYTDFNANRSRVEELRTLFEKTQ